MHQKKWEAKQTWRTWVKVKKVHIFVAILITFLWGIFLPTDLKSAWNFAFFDTRYCIFEY